MTDHPMFLEYDWTFNAYRAHFSRQSRNAFETLGATRHALHLCGLQLEAKSDERTLRIEFMAPVAERVDFSPLGIGLAE